MYMCLHQDSSDSVMPQLSQKQFTKLNSDHLGMWGRRKYDLQLSLRFGRLSVTFQQALVCAIFAIKLRLRTVIKSSGEGSKSPKQRSKSKSKTLDVVFLLPSWSNSRKDVQWVSTFNWLVVSTHLKNISQIGNLPQTGVNIWNIWKPQAS